MSAAEGDGRQLVRTERPRPVDGDYPSIVKRPDLLPRPTGIDTILLAHRKTSPVTSAHHELFHLPVELTTGQDFTQKHH